MRSAGRARVIIAIVVGLMAVAFDTPSQAGPAVAGDQTAWQEVSAAFHKLETMSYRMRMTAPGQVVIVERVPPDSTRMITQITGQVGELESVTVAGETRARVNGPGVPGTWFCREVDPHLPAIDPRNSFGVGVEASRGPDILIAGTPVHTYELTSTIQGDGKTATTTTILYVEIRTGLPKRSITPYPLGPGNVIIDYYDYGAPLIIVLPPCP